jgi:perosamine synthetase
MIPISKPIIGKDVHRAVVKVLKSGNLTQGPEVAAFEKEFSNIVGERPCVAVNSGTSALHLALLSLGIGPEDEIIVPSFTFAATVNSVSLTGAKPIFVDIDRFTYNIDVNLIEAAITARTRAILVVHLYGLPANMNAINEIAIKNNLFIIEDAAQAHGAMINNRITGTFGDAAAFSFYATKNITSGEGGMIVFKQETSARLARLYRNQGMEQRYKNEIVGFNLRMTDLQAAIGRAQLKHLKEWTEKRQLNARYLSHHLEGVEVPFTPANYTHVFHQYTISTKKNRDVLSQKLTERGIGNGIYYPIPVHELQSFNVKLNLPETTKATQRVLSIPVHPSLTKRDLKYIVRSLNQLIDEL